MIDNDSDARNEAAALAFATLQFEQEAAYPRHGSSAQKKIRGVDDFLFLPSWIPTPSEKVVEFLAGLTSPALMFQTTMRGVVSLVLVNELSGERRAWAEKTLSNQLAGVDDFAAQFYPPLDGQSRVLLEIRDKSHIVSLDVLRIWAQNYGCPVGWSLGNPRSGAPREVSAQMRLLSSDGRVSPPTDIAENVDA